MDKYDSLILGVLLVLELFFIINIIFYSWLYAFSSFGISAQLSILTIIGIRVYKKFVKESKEVTK